MSEKTSSPRYWFPAKSYGLGWGLPRVWQGWTTLVAYVVVIAVLAHQYPPHEVGNRFWLVTGLPTLALVLVCLIKGEPPRWRWGRK
ncbi:hypothetical protein [Dyella sp.]|uniref:hypothetical protein n=1 Tax=Dyella sp. TaxID=1869338 RepID=UPI002ED34B50